jgi:flagellar basal-body rod modification protein FlgD
MISTNPITNDASLPFRANAASNTQSSSSANSSATGSDSLADPNTFITLLTTQLQAQDPLNPMSPSEMVDQLTQVNSLQQLMQIQQDLQTMLGGSASTAPTPAA